ERLLADGSPDWAANVRVRVQARQAFYYAAIASLGWCEQGEQVSIGITDFVERFAAHPEAGGGYTHLLNPDWQVSDSKQDLYDHAFFLLAFAWQYRAFGNKQALASAHRLMAHLDKHLGAMNGGWLEGDYAYTHRRQNPHMHLFEAFMALYEASGEAVWLARAGQMFTLFQTRFYHADAEVLLEFFAEDWTPSPGEPGTLVEPGHMLEWVWLLDWYSRLSGQPVRQYTGALYRKALAIGVIAETGLVYDVVDIAGEVVEPTKRCWGLTEMIKASLVMAREGEPGAEERAAAGVDTLFSYYLNAQVVGSYVDRLGADDAVIEANAPASSLYHLLVLAQELMRYCQPASPPTDMES
ncbi:MAG TPA: AGE family epimerase/isomerase, partial [Marinobacter sp.]|nr:AGE family epimerase/isomerase [Marinobacter sp.]